jgi:hypothetical protein
MNVMIQVQATNHLILHSIVLTGKMTLLKIQQRIPKTNNFLALLEELPTHEHRHNEAREEYRSEQFILHVILP